MNAPLRQRVGTDKCAKCRQPFKPGDRVTVVYIVTKVGKNPSAKAFDFGAFLSEDFELAHVSCTDTGLNGYSLITT